MKTIYKRLFTVCLLAFVLSAVFSFDSHAETYGEFSYVIVGNKCIITGLESTSSGEITVPDTINGKVVNSIAEAAFENCIGLSVVHLPQTIETIGKNAFFGCSNLTEFHMPDSVTSVGDGVFGRCKNLTDVQFSENATVIPKNAFYNCSKLKNVHLSSKTAVLSDGAFYGCSSLEKIILSEKVSIISESCFYGCSSLSGIYVPSTLVTIGKDAFEGCTSLKTVFYAGSPESVKSLSVSSGNALLIAADWACNHLHKADVIISYVEPTCINDGYMKSVCVCGAVNETDHISALGHDLSILNTISEPDCKNKGVVNVCCSRCEYYEQVSIPESGHKVVIDEGVPASCVTEGKTRGSHCYVCGEVLVAQETIPVTDHDFTKKIFDEKYLVSPATYSKCAVYKFACSTCNKAGDSTFNGDCLFLQKPASIVSLSTSNSITLGWSKVNFASFYGVYYKNSAGQWRLYKVVTENIIKISPLASGALIEFAVRAFAVENGVKVASPYFVTIKEATKPLKPAKVVSTQNETAIKITWTPSAGATGYRVLIYNPIVRKWVVATSSTTICGSIIYGLQSGVNYAFAILPYISTGTKIVWGEESATILTSTRPAAPVLKATSLKGGVRFVWDKINGADGYVLYGSLNPNSGYVRVCVTSNLTQTITGLYSNQNYYFRAFAYKKVGSTIIYSYANVKDIKTK